MGIQVHIIFGGVLKLYNFWSVKVPLFWRVSHYVFGGASYSKFSALRFIDLWCARFIFFRGLQVGYIFAFKCSPAFAFLGVHLSNVFKFERINITLLTVGPYKL